MANSFETLIESVKKWLVDPSWNTVEIMKKKFILFSQTLFTLLTLTGHEVMWNPCGCMNTSKLPSGMFSRSLPL